MSRAAPSADAGFDPRRAALVIAGALFMEGFDSSVILTSLPRMAADLGGTPVSLSIAVTAYLLALAIFIPVSGWFADRFGARRVYCWAIAVFAVGSLACGLSHTATELVAGRFVQGMGASMMTPVGRLILARSTDKRELVTVMNYMILPGLLGPSAGPLVGGFISAYLSWRWNFFINLPIAAAGILATLRYVRPPPGGRPGAFDWGGFALIAVAAASLQIAFESQHRPLVAGLGPWPWAALAAAVSAAYLVYARRTPNAVMDLAMFRIRTFRVAVLPGTLARAGVFTTQFLLPAMLQTVYGMDAFRAGAVTFLIAMGSFVVRPIVNALLGAVGFRSLAFGTSLVAAGLLAGFTGFRPPGSMILLCAYILVFGIIRSAFFSSLGALALADVEPEDMGRSNSISAFAQRMSMSLGVSVAAASLSLASGGAPLAHKDFSFAFLFAAVLTLGAGLFMLKLKPSDGWRVSGYGAPED